GHGESSQARLKRAVLKHALAVVDIEGRIFAHQVRNHQILGAVVVAITGVNSHAGLRTAVSVYGASCEHGSVLEGAIPLVDPELVRPLIVGHKDVSPTIAVKIRADH